MRGRFGRAGRRQESQAIAHFDGNPVEDNVPPPFMSGWDKDICHLYGTVGVLTKEVQMG
jgi:hypothetical protein